MKAKNHSPLQYNTWFTTPATFETFCLCTVLVQVISHHNQCSDNCNLGYSLVVYPTCTRQTKKFQRLSFFTLKNFSVFSITFYAPVGVIYSITQKIPLKWYIKHGLGVHHSYFKKIWYFPRVGKGWRWNYEGGRVNEKKMTFSCELRILSSHNSSSIHKQ